MVSKSKTFAPLKTFLPSNLELFLELWPLLVEFGPASVAMGAVRIKTGLSLLFTSLVRDTTKFKTLAFVCHINMAASLLWGLPELKLVYLCYSPHLLGTLLNL